MSTITKVVLAGAAGNLGPAILKQLIDAGFEVTVLTRQSSTNTFPANVKVAPVDYESLESLTNALKGHDALVSTLGAAALKTQIRIVDAAAQAGLKRFIPSEFGCDTLNEKAAKLPVFADKIAVHPVLEEHAKSDGLSYTLLLTGPFFDWGLQSGFIISPARKTATLYDGGDAKFSTTTLSDIGKAVVGVLKHPEETANRAVYVQSTVISGKELLARAQKATGGAEGWAVKETTVAETLDSAWAELKKEKPDPTVFIYGFLFSAVYGEGYNSEFQKLDNDLLGIKQLTDDEVQAIFDKAAQ